MEFFVAFLGTMPVLNKYLELSGTNLYNHSVPLLCSSPSAWETLMLPINILFDMTF